MSKAFTRESDNDIEDAPLPARALLPPGVKNYITPSGAQRLRDELAALLAAKAAGTERKLDGRIRQLNEIVSTLTVAEIPSERDVIRFGAIVRLRRGTGPEDVYRLVGVDEIDLDRNHISWQAPLARALIGHRAGDRVRFRAPNGVEEIAIVSVSYA